MPLPEANFVPQLVPAALNLAGLGPMMLFFFLLQQNCTRAHFIVGELGQLGLARCFCRVLLYLVLQKKSTPIMEAGERSFFVSMNVASYRRSLHFITHSLT